MTKSNVKKKNISIVNLYNGRNGLINILIHIQFKEVVQFGMFDEDAISISY